MKCFISIHGRGRQSRHDHGRRCDRDGGGEGIRFFFEILTFLKPDDERWLSATMSLSRDTARQVGVRVTINVQN